MSQMVKRVARCNSAVRAKQSCTQAFAHFLRSLISRVPPRSENAKDVAVGLRLVGSLITTGEDRHLGR